MVSNKNIQIINASFFGFILILLSPLSFAHECRIEGYAYAIDCIEFATQNENDFDVTVFKVSATVRYPHPEPIIWIPDGLVLNASERAPSMIATLSRVRSQRDFLWLELQSPQKKILQACNPDTHLTQLKIADMANRIDPLQSPELLMSCKKSIAQLNDMNQFSYESIAKVYENTRKKLGLQQVVVVAEGRGAAIALAWQQLAPEAIRFSVLDSPVFYKLDFNIEQAVSQENALKAVFNACRKSVRCNKSYPNPQGDFLTIIEKLPQTISVKDPLTLQTTTLEMTDQLFLQGMQFLLRTPSRAKTLPMLLASARSGDWQPFIGMLSVGWAKKNNEANFGLYLLETCNRFDESEAARAQDLNNLATWFFQTDQKRLQAMCGNTQARGIKSAVFHTPSLVLTGGVNPARQKTLSFFKNKTVIDAKNAGANLLGYGCTKDVVYRYFKALDSAENQASPPDLKKMDATCITKIPYPSMDSQPFFLKDPQ